MEDDEEREAKDEDEDKDQDEGHIMDAWLTFPLIVFAGGLGGAGAAADAATGAAETEKPKANAAASFDMVTPAARAAVSIAS